MRSIDSRIDDERRRRALYAMMGRVEDVQRQDHILDGMIALRDEERSNVAKAFELMAKWEPKCDTDRPEWPERRCRGCDRRLQAKEWGYCQSCRLDQNQTNQV